jgi:hypothetical protein
MPELMLDIFNNNAFSMVAMTDAVNLVPNTYGRVGELNLFPNKPQRAHIVALEHKQGFITLIPSQERGGPPAQHKTGERGIRYIEVPHFPLDDRIVSKDLELVRAYPGGPSVLMQLMDLINERLAEIRPKHDITLEFLRNGALSGLILAPNGSTILDLFSEFGITQKVVYFDLSNASSDIKGHCRTVLRHIEDNLAGDRMTGVRALCGENFWDDFISHGAVKEAYSFYEGVNPLRDDVRKGFRYQGITWEEYRGQATNAAGNTMRFIGADEVRFVPEGCRDTFGTFIAPADYFETLGTPGKPVYSKLSWDTKQNRYVDIHTQSNVMPMCRRPAVLVKGMKGAES